MTKPQDLFTILNTELSSGDFIKLHLNNYKGTEQELKKILIKPIVIKKGLVLNFTYRYSTKDITKNYTQKEAVERLESYLNFNNFRQANYFSCINDISFQMLNSEKNILRKTKPSHLIKPVYNHDKNKNRKITSDNASYLTDLKITDDNGRVYNHAQDKFKQINHYVEILSGLLKNLPEKDTYRAVDMGSGKGYLTFALYDYLSNTLNKKAELIGVEFRDDLVSLCNKIAEKSNFEGLGFIEGTIQDFSIEKMDILIALHACDTATDDAIKKGIDADADLIVVAPCCHKQVRRELEENKHSNDLDFLTRHGIFMERHAEMLTDGLRAQILEFFGYKTRVFEFIALDHTPKNVLIVAQKSNKTTVEKEQILKDIKRKKEYFGISTHYLEKIMKL